MNEANTTHCFQDNTGRFPIDSVLRNNGYKIYSRRKGKEAEWLKGGAVFPQKIAERTIDFYELEKAQMELEDYYFKYCWM